MREGYPVHRPHYDDMIASLMAIGNAAFDVGAGTIYERCAVGAITVLNPGKFVGEWCSEMLCDIRLIFAQYRKRKGMTFLQDRHAARVQVNACQDHLRIKRNSSKRADG